jgi:hypothetical protein
MAVSFAPSNCHHQALVNHLPQTDSILHLHNELCATDSKRLNLRVDVVAGALVHTTRASNNQLSNCGKEDHNAVGIRWKSSLIPGAFSNIV